MRKILKLNNSFSISQQIFFAQRLSLLLDSNISLVESLRIMKSMDISISRQSIYDQIILNCERGVSLSKSMQQSSTKFDQLLITLINNGEYSGSLVTSLLQASKNLEKRNELKKKIISTLIYPTFIFIATIGMTLFLVLYIFPKILPMLGTLNIKLPFLTRAVKFLYEYTIDYGLYTVLTISILFFIFIYILKKSIRFRSVFSALLLKLPLLGAYISLSTNSTLCSIGEMLLSSGRSLTEFYLFSRDYGSNILFKRAFEDIHEKSNKGISFSTAMSHYPHLFSKIMIDMCSVGERTGNLALMFGHCSRIFEQDMDTFIKRFTALIEPILMIFMGIVVGSVALSIILPVYEITNHLTK